jgi:hypothetical protein
MKMRRKVIERMRKMVNRMKGLRTSKTRFYNDTGPKLRILYFATIFFVL